MMRRCVILGVLLTIGISLTAVGLENTFGESDLGYTINYASDWVVERPSEFTVRFTGVAWSPASQVAFAIQNLASTSIGGQYADVDDVLNAMKCQLVTGPGDVCIYDGELIRVVDTSGRELVGPQIIAEYEYDGEIYKQWLTVVPHGSGDIFYLLTYTALQDDYDRFEPTVLSMLSTWTIGETTSTASSSTSTSSPTTSSSEIVILFEDSGHLGPYDYAADAYDKRLYPLLVPSHGYMAIAVIDETGESISGWVHTTLGAELMHKPGGFAEIYTDAYEVFAGSYFLKVGQDTMVTESDFAVYVFFSTSSFTVDDLEATFGSRYQTMP